MAQAQQSESRALALHQEFRGKLTKMSRQFATVLPAHIPPERFERVVLNAVQRTPRLLLCDEASLWNACMQSAEDALLPDKREGAIVPFKKGKDDDGGSPGAAGDYVAVWIPMVFGIRKLVRQSGEVRDLNVQLVFVDEFEAGAFEHEFGDSHFIKHRRLPPPVEPAKRKVYCAYSQAWDRQGFRFVPEIMFEAEIMAIGSRSKSFKAGPWSDPLFALEMRKKTVTKRHFKQLPTSRDLDRVLRRDDELYSFGGEARKEQITAIRGGAGAALQHFANPTPERITITAAKVEERADRGDDRGGGEEPPPAERDGRPEPEPVEESKATAKPAAAEGPTPASEAEYAAAFRAYLASAKSAGAIDARWKRDMPARNKLNMAPELRNALDEERKAKMAELAK
jgi:recombination protein RecT